MYTTNLVVKVASRCNLNCTYCYMYNMGDESYKLQPKFMSQEVIEAMFLKIKNNCLAYNLDSFTIIFHGGEPLLTGIDFYKNFIEIEKRIIPSNIKIIYSMQSNGILIDEEVANTLKDLNIQIGISLDGSPSSNNKNRIYHNGKGSYKEIIRGIDIIKKVYGENYASCLCVIDTNENPRDVYNHFKDIGVNDVNYLFQDLNYLHYTMDSVPKIGKWIIQLFDLWYKDLSVNKPSIRLFNELIGLIFGLNKSSETLGKGVNNTLVIETDGSIEPVDSLKICGEGFTKTKFNVLKDELDSIYKNSELAKSYYNAHHELCQTCQDCPLEAVCGGGFLGHRYSKNNGFDNPSIYCKEIIEIICHIQNEVLKNIPPEIIEDAGIEALNYKEILDVVGV